MIPMPGYAALRPQLAASAFRSRFRPSPKDRAAMARLGRFALAGQAEHRVRTALAPASPFHDGKQTPMRGSPLFIAQHATGCCCRSCLFKWHGIPPGRALTEAEIAYVVKVLMDFLDEFFPEAGEFPYTPELFQ